jgi:hypothetical protein
MKNFLLFNFLIFFSFSSALVYSQNQEAIDSLNYILKKTKSDTVKVDLLINLSDEYFNVDIEKAEKHIDQALKTYQKS